MLLKSIKLLASGVYKYILPISLASLICVEWSSLSTTDLRVMMSCALILLVRVENSLTLYRFYKQQSSYEYEITVFLSTVKLVNQLQPVSQLNAQRSQFYANACGWAFDVFLLLNVATYVLAFLIFLIFGFFMLAGFVNGDLQLINLRRGLTPEEFEQLTKKTWREFRDAQRAAEIPEEQREEQRGEPNQLHQIQHPAQSVLERASASRHQRKESLPEGVQEGRSAGSDPQRAQSRRTLQAQDDEVCPICLTNFQDEEVLVQLPKCNHYFHTECIQQWLAVQPICPFCRSNIRLAQFI